LLFIQHLHPLIDRRRRNFDRFGNLGFGRRHSETVGVSMNKRKKLSLSRRDVRHSQFDFHIQKFRSL
jgi:hypothetical protein